MKTIYAVACPFYGDAEASALGAWNHTLEWVDPTGSLDGATDAPTGRAELPTGASVRWTVVESGEACVRRLEHQIPETETSPLGWRTVVWVCRDQDRSWAQIRGGPENRAWVVSSVPYEAGRPQLVSRWLADLVVVRDGLRLSASALNYGQNDVPKLIEMLLDPRRELPVVAISKTMVDGVQRPLVSPHDLAYELAGDAHVVVLDHAAGWKITDALGQDLSIFHGGVRIWWPGLSPTDDPPQHPLFVGDRITQDRRRVVNFVTSRVWSAAVDGVGPPPLETVLIRARSRAAADERVAQLRRELASADDASEASDEFLAELERQLDENEVLHERLDELETVNQELRASMAALEAGDHDARPDDPPEVDSVHEAVQKAASEASNVVYLNGAYSSALESEFPNPQLVLDHLRAISRVADRWKAGDLAGGFSPAFEAESVLFKPGISFTARTKYKVDYEMDYADGKVMMGPHLRRGVGAVTKILRIYWFEDSTTRQLVVGHVGKKLRDASNP